MSKLYKELKYDTDRVMQPGDPLTSFDGNTAIRAGDATGKGFIETYGDEVPHYYDVTVDIPQVPGASCRVRMNEVMSTDPGIQILSIKGWPGATIGTQYGNQFFVNGSHWGNVFCEPGYYGETYPANTAIPLTDSYDGKVYVVVYQNGSGQGQPCPWSNLEHTRQLVSSKEIIAAAEETANKVLASPSSGSGAVSFRSLVAADIPDLNTSKLTAGTLGVARGGTGKSSHTVNSILAGNASSTTGTIQNIPTVSGALYATAVNGQASFGTLPIAQGGTGATTAANALTNLGAAASDHTHDSLRSSASTTIYATTSINDSGDMYLTTVGGGGAAVLAPAPRANATYTLVKILGQEANIQTQQANKVLAGPASGSAGAISFRSLTVADLPTGTTSSTVALGNHMHSDYVSKTVTGNNQAIQTGLSIATDKSISMGGETGKGNIVLCAATNTANTYILVGSTDGEYIYIEKDKVGYTSDGEQTASMLKFPPASTEVKTIATTEELNILPITTSTALSITMTADKYMYKVTDSGATGTFPTLTAPTGLPASCYYKFELEWVTASPTATYAQTDSTTPAMKWISSPVMQTDGLNHTYHISGRYDTTTSTFWMSCWKIDDAQGTITPDSHTLKYLLTTPAQTTSTTTNTNDTITVQLSDHAINSVNVPVSVTNVVLKFPGQAIGKARDFFVRLIVTGSTVPSITLTEPDGSAIDFDVDDDSWTEIEQGVNLLMFTETAQ